MHVRNRMTTNPYTIAPDATIAEALDIMRQNKIRRLPVVKSGKLVGIVTEREMLEVSPSKATTLSIFEMNYLLAKTKVSTVMTRDVKTISPDALLEEAAVLLRDNDIGALPVVENGKVIGIITETDIFDAFIDLMGARDVGSRIAIDAPDTPGVLADITKVIKEYGANITHLTVYRGQAGRSTVILRVNTLNVKDMVKTLEDAGYSIVSVIKNE